MKPEFDCSLYLVTDQGLAGERDFEEIVAAAIRGGVTLVQLREKTAGSGEFYRIACMIKRVTDFYHVPLMINDRADIALAAGAAGVHVGQSDIPAAAVRRMIGADKILGVSARTLEEAEKAESDGADYLGVGAVFPTTTKKDAESVSVETLQKICRSVEIPVVAIGGVDEKNVDKLSGSGISGIAVVSAIMKAEKPEKMARMLKEKSYGLL